MSYSHLRGLRASPMYSTQPTAPWQVVNGDGETIADYLEGSAARLFAAVERLRDGVRLAVTDLTQSTRQHAQVCACAQCSLLATLRQDLQQTGAA